MTRTIHPVGHGAFYTEEFADGFTVVYDCGSSSSNTHTYIDSTIRSLKRIDLLFISHFHQDHINKIISILDYKIPINRLIVPYYPLEEKLLLIGNLSTNSSNYYQTARFILSPRSFLQEYGYNEVKISAVSEPEEGHRFNDEGYNDLIPSGQNIPKSSENQHFNKDIDWIYIPFNLKSMSFKKRAEGFYDYLVGINHKFANPIQITIAKDLEDIRKAYLAFFKRSPNETSMPVFSTPANPIDIIAFDKNCQTNSYCRDCKDFVPRFASCLYSGDFQIKHYSQQELSSIYNTLQRYKIGMIQVPHHCSKTSFVRDFWDKISSINNNIISFISHGYRYRLPHKPLMNHLLNQGFKVREVTDNPYTILKVDIFK